MNAEQRILEAALKVFASEGYTGATTRKIAEEANVAEVTLFRKFKSKENLLKEVLNNNRTVFSSLDLLFQIQKDVDIETELRILGKNVAKAMKDRKKDNKIFNFNKDLVNKNILCIIYLILYNYNYDYRNYIYKNNFNFIENILYKKFINNLNKEWNDTKWIISFKFDLIFSNDHKNILLNNLNEYIKDDKLVLLINSLLNKGILTKAKEEDPPYKVWKILQIVDPDPYSIFKINNNFYLKLSNKLDNLLIDVFFHKLDKKINSLKINFYKKFNNFDYIVKDQNSFNFMNYFSNGNSLNNNILNYNIYIKYLRYYDSFIIGIDGINSSICKWQINEIKNEIHLFLKNELLLKNIYSYIVDIHYDNFKFMNIILSNGLNTNNKHKIIFLSSRYLIFNVLINIGMLNRERKPIGMKRLLKFNINYIISTYIKINNIIINSFHFCHDYISLLKLMFSILYSSLKLTLQLKLNYKYNTDIIKLLIKLNLIDPNLLRYLYFLKNKSKNRNVKIKYKYI